MMKKFLLISILFIVLMAIALPVSAEIPEEEKTEKILSFHSDIIVHKDASMTVRETIKVRALEEKIKRGIYRDFPTRYKDNLGDNYVVAFDVEEVLRDGNHEPHHVEGISNGKRVYIGTKDVFIPSGEYTYMITYKTNRQLGFFKDFDELYWNVTGNEWEFQIDKASVSIELPEDASRKVISSAGYTGPKGEQGKDFTMSIDNSGIVHFSTTRPLAYHEGLTIAVSWPKGYVTEPDTKTKFNYFLSDNIGTIIGVIGLGFLFLYYIIIWMRVGKDPEAGVIVPRYTPPDRMSPAIMRFIKELGYDDKTSASAIINLAVKGVLTIKEEDGEYTLHLKDNTISPLSPEERKGLNVLFSSKKEIALKQANHKIIKSAIDAIREHLKLNFEKIYFITNKRYFISGLILSIIILMLSGFWSAESKDALPVFLFMSVWLTGWSFGVFFLVSMVISRWKAIWGGSKKISDFGSAIFISLFALPFVFGEISGIYMLGYSTSAIVILFLVLIVIINYTFYHLLKAPTLAGRKMLDAIEGFKVFLTATEKERLNLLNPPEKTPELFEKYLPYALALDVEQQWSEQFSDILSAAAIEGREYSPSWYSGAGWSAVNAGAFASSFGNSLSNTISSSSTAPGSRSGSGGGGSSGGGGGGGGGGGW